MRGWRGILVVSVLVGSLGFAVCTRAAGLWADAPALVAGLAASLLAPALLVALLAARPGPDGASGVGGHVDAVLGARADSEHDQNIVRIGLVLCVFAYVCVSYLAGRDAALLDVVLTYPAIQGLSYLLFVHIVLDPAPSEWRRVVGNLADVGFVSLFLHLGGAAAAAWYPIYLWVTLGNGFRYGTRALAISAVLSLLGFALVVASTPIWRGLPHLSVGLLIALGVIPAYAASLIRRLVEAKSEAEAANRSKGRFLATVTHELRTPLTAIVGAAELLRSSPGRVDPREVADTVRGAADGLLDLVGDILDLAQVEEGRLRVEAAPFAPAQLIFECREMAAMAAFGKPIRVEVRVEPGLPERILGDARRLRQVLANLLGNAVKFTERGSVTLSAARGEFPGGAPALVLEVADTGIGIAPGNLERIFERFTQADEEINRAYGGAGLGLAISRQLVSLMGGRVTAESTVGVGSRFRILLPLVEAPAAAEQEQDRPGLTVLVADDNPVNRQILGSMLTALGHRAELAVDGEDALDRLAQGGYDAVLLDMNMPRKSGLDVSRLWRFMEPAGNRLPILALTAEATEEARRLCAEAGMDGFLSKPITLDGLRQALAGLDSLRQPGGAPIGEGPAIGAPLGSDPGPDPEDPVLDARMLDQLVQVTGDAVVVDGIIADFLSDGAGIVAALKTAAAGRDRAAFRDHAHALRSSAGYLGGVRLSRLLAAAQTGRAAAERAAGASGAGDGALADAIDDEFRRLREAIAEWRASAGSGAGPGPRPGAP
ncbi:ATP-binding protein [Arenibaculum pallidiluteum]|uniref:ATP-binding protein n=1 Tax=Arenibaculum pallidiluteum TaxID=2812559 RepID=UPI001A95A30A|nr:ATP-binding protein [Arenibaculum pallidiluteum]